MTERLICTRCGYAPQRVMRWLTREPDGTYRCVREWSCEQRVRRNAWHAKHDAA